MLSSILIGGRRVTNFKPYDTGGNLLLISFLVVYGGKLGKSGWGYICNEVLKARCEELRSPWP